MNIHNNLVRALSVIILLSLVQTSCDTPPTPTSPDTDDLQNIQVQKTEVVRTVLEEYEEFPLPNCDATGPLTQQLGQQTTVRKVVTIGNRASLSGGGEVSIPAAAKVKLEAAVELAYQQVYESARTRLDTITMVAQPGSHVVYVIQWEEQKFASIVSYNVASEAYQVPYTFAIYAPKMTDKTHQVNCPAADPPTAIPAPITQVPTTSELSLEEARREAEKQTAQWFDALEMKDVDTLVSLSNPPFYIDNEILISVSDIRTVYQEMVDQGPSEEGYKINRIMSGTIQEYKELGYITAGDRLLSGLQLEDDDIVVAVFIQDEGIAFYFRWLGKNVEMAGWWD